MITKKIMKMMVMEELLFFFSPVWLRLLRYSSWRLRAKSRRASPVLSSFLGS